MTVTYMFESLHFHRIEISFFEKGFRLYAFGFPALLISTYLTMEDVTEHEQEQCEENGQDCRECPDLMIKEQEAAGHERYNTDS